MRKVVLKPETAKRLEAVLDDSERNSSFVDTKSLAITDRRNHWLKIVSSEPSDWDAEQLVYTVDVYVTPMEDTAIHTGAKMFNAAEVGGTGGELEADTFVKAVDFLAVDDEWYYVVSASGGSGLPPAEDQFTGLYANPMGVWTIDWQRLRGD